MSSDDERARFHDADVDAFAFADFFAERGGVPVDLGDVVFYLGDGLGDLDVPIVVPSTLVLLEQVRRWLFDLIDIEVVVCVDEEEVRELALERDALFFQDAGVVRAAARTPS